MCAGTMYQGNQVDNGLNNKVFGLLKFLPGPSSLFAGWGDGGEEGWSRKSAYDSVKIKNRSRKQSHKRDGTGVGKIRTFPFSSDLIGTSLIRSRENQIVGVGIKRLKDKPITMHVTTLCDWFSSSASASASACDSENLVFT